MCQVCCFLRYMVFSGMFIISGMLCSQPNVCSVLRYVIILGPR